MRPVLFHIGSFPLRAWGFLLMIGEGNSACQEIEPGRREAFRHDEVLYRSL